LFLSIGRTKVDAGNIVKLPSCRRGNHGSLISSGGKFNELFQISRRLQFINDGYIASFTLPVLFEAHRDRQSL